MDKLETRLSAHSKIAYLIDDDRDVRVSLGMLLATIDVTGWPFPSAIDFLEALPHLKPGCLIVDVRMAEMDGLELLQRLNEQRLRWPAIMITGHGDVPAAVTSLKRGAVDFIEKPFEAAVLFEALERAFETLEQKVGREQRAGELVDALTPRERDAFEGLVRGETSKEVARRLGLSPRTAEMHRSRMMKKLKAERAADVLAIAAAAGYRLGNSRSADEGE
jgi:two-component system response regulator FixJ